MNSDVKKLTYAEKVRLLMAENYWGNNSLGGKIYSFVVADGPLGLRRAKDLKDGGGQRLLSVCRISFRADGSPDME